MAESRQNPIANSFRSFGPGSHREDWFCSDFLKAYHPDTYDQIVNSTSQEVGDRLLVALMDEVHGKDSEHKERVLDWLEGLREMKNSPELRSFGERSGMNRGIVTE